MKQMKLWNEVEKIRCQFIKRLLARARGTCARTEKEGQNCNDGHYPRHL